MFGKAHTDVRGISHYFRTETVLNLQTDPCRFDGPRKGIYMLETKLSVR